MSSNEIDLKIRPRMVGGGREIAPLDRSLTRFHNRQSSMLRQQEQGVNRVRRAYSALGRAAMAGTRFVGGLTRELFSMQSVVVGIAGGLAGRTLMEHLIGPNRELQASMTTFKVLVGDAEKAKQLVQDVRATAARTPFSERDLLEGSKRLLRLTGSNIERNKELLSLAQTMAAVNPSKNISEASEALLDAETGEFERLKEFGIKLGKGDIDKAKKAGQDWGDAALTEVIRAVEKQTGGRDIVGALADEVQGKQSTLKDRLRNTFARIGEPVFEEFSKGLDGALSALDELEADPQFQQDIRDLGGAAADLVKFGADLVTKLPQGIGMLRELVADTKAFAEEHGTLLGLGAGALVANRASGGALGRGALSLAGRGASRLLFGRGGGGGGGGAAGAAGMLGAEGAIPVFVVNMGGGGMGGGGLSEFGIGGSGAAASAAAEKRATQGTLARIATSLQSGGLVGAGAQLAPFIAAIGSFALAVETFQHSSTLTNRIVERNSNVERLNRSESSYSRPDRFVGVNASFGGGFNPSAGSQAKRIRRLVDEGKFSEAKALTMKALGGAGNVLGKSEQATLTEINDALLGHRVAADIQRGGSVGDLTFRPTLGAGRDAAIAGARKVSKLLKENPHLINDPRFRQQIQGFEEEAEALLPEVRRGQQMASQLNAAKVDIQQVTIQVEAGNSPKETVDKTKRALEQGVPEMRKIIRDSLGQQSLNGG